MDFKYNATIGAATTANFLGSFKYSFRNDGYHNFNNYNTMSWAFNINAYPSQLIKLH